MSGPQGPDANPWQGSGADQPAAGAEQPYAEQPYAAAPSWPQADLPAAETPAWAPPGTEAPVWGQPPAYNPQQYSQQYGQPYHRLMRWIVGPATTGSSNKSPLYCNRRRRRKLAGLAQHDARKGSWPQLVSRFSPPFQNVNVMTHGPAPKPHDRAGHPPRPR